MDTRHRILLADDEASITDTFGPALERLGYVVAIARDGEGALRLVPRFRPDLIILDRAMPKVTGDEVLRKLRADGNDTPVIILSQHADSPEIALTLSEGADDFMLKPQPLLDRGLMEYMNKPFGLSELVARMKKQLDRAAPSPCKRSLEKANVLVSGALRLDRRAGRAYLDSQALGLRRSELRLLDYLMTHPGELLSREQLLDRVWGWDFVGGTRTVDTHIGRIRRALHDDASCPTYIETVRGVGYRFIGPVEVCE